MASAPLASSVSSIVNSTPSPVFHQVVEGSPKMKDLTDIFNRILVPLYGNQDKALKQIAEGKDRTCFLLFEEETPVGVIAFKTVLSDEFKDFGVSNSIEIKSLFVVSSDKNSGRGIGGTLLNKVIDEVNRLALGHASFHVTVSDTKMESLNFFRRKGFQVKHVWISRYQSNITEFLLALPAATASPQSLQNRVTQISPALLTPKVVFSVANAHLDDIHDLKMLSNGNILSGSKDNCILQWDQNGKALKPISEVEPEQRQDNNWVNCLQVLNKDYWISGECNGQVALWTTEGEFVKYYNLKLPRGGHISQAHNARRVNCLAVNNHATKPTFFVGLPTLFDEFNVIEGRTVSSTKVHKNDWVYCVHPLSDAKLLLGTGCVLDLFEKREERWQKTQGLIGEGPKMNRQRPFISSLIPLTSSPAHFALSVFGGGVRILDVEKSTFVQDWREHTLRVWKVVNIGKELLASCAEDRTIKIWDPRATKSIATIGTENGQAHSLLSLNDNILLGGVSQESGKKRSDSAHLLFYDLRK